MKPFTRHRRRCHDDDDDAAAVATVVVTASSVFAAAVTKCAVVCVSDAAVSKSPLPSLSSLLSRARAIGLERCPLLLLIPPQLIWRRWTEKKRKKQRRNHTKGTERELSKVRSAMLVRKDKKYWINGKS